ncbi:UDP-N-acetylmuramoyl-L-alanine--D-glutamate ligase, partial [candidate division FCPU426 bacterium]|nr:UDP-N-acetylmuramoyl-L-alanine--D-glutamate ligase [candidate division FCPU426 bacterium]
MMKPRMELDGKKVLVVGMARSGCAAAALLCKHGAHVTITDKKNAEALKTAIDQISGLPVKIETGGHHPDTLKSAELIVLSPGVSLEQPVIREARELGIPVISELELGYRFCAGRIAAVTGTNGKTTTVHLLAQMVKDAGVSCVLAGNMGRPFTDVAEQVPEQGVVVLEVSSFQLETIQYFRPHVAAILNITPDHLDRYPNMQSYIEAKARIISNQKASDVLVLNSEDKYTPLLANQAQGRLLTFSPYRPPEIEGTWVERGRLYFRLFGLGQGEMMLADELLIPGPHNLENALAAAAIGLALGVAPKSLVTTMRQFRGVAHRLEPVKRIKGVWYINDSKGTNVDAVTKALQSYQSPIILILGGRDKNGDFQVLRELLSQHARAVVVMGEAAEIIAKQIEGTVQIIHEKELAGALRAAASMAGEGDIVLFSPGCASFDQFRDFE